MTAEECGDVIFLRQAPEEVPHLAFSGQVKPPRRFVEKQHLGTAHERARNLDPPLHARAVGANEFASKPEIQADVLQNTLDLTGHIGDVTDAGKVGQVLPRRPSRLAFTGLVTHESDESAHRERFPDNVVAPQLRGSFAGRQQRREHANGGGLARAVEAQKPVQMPLGNLQRDAVDSDEIAEPAGEAIGLDGVVGRGAHRVRRQRANAAPRQIKGRTADAAPIS